MLISNNLKGCHATTLNFGHPFHYFLSSTHLTKKLSSFVKTYDDPIIPYLTGLKVCMGSTKMCLGHYNTKLGQTKVQSGRKRSSACNNNHVHIYNIATLWVIGTKHHYVNNENKCQDANSAYPMGTTCKVALTP